MDKGILFSLPITATDAIPSDRDPKHENEQGPAVAAHESPARSPTCPVPGIAAGTADAADIAAADTAAADTAGPD